MTYSLRSEQWIARPIDEVFAFFANAQNLERITPPWLGFKILSISTHSISEGTVIRYRLRLHGIPIHWRTEICEWNPPHCFVDEQTKGPYKRWRHTHRFEAHGSRTKMIDEVQYSLPFGVLGRIVHAVKVRGDVNRIFDYRRLQIDALFGQPGENAA
ncbi:MAG TPA: SRPBCC family protein [Acidisarcina sp.]|nr:SRPBCC family protein [Acidisarcina sp.]